MTDRRSARTSTDLRSPRRAALLVLVAGCALAACAGPAGRTPTSAAVAGQPSDSVTATADTGTAADTEPAGTVAPALTECTGGMLPTQTPGALTVATAEPAAAPWFTPGNPTSGEGLESSVAYAIADVLGYPHDQVSWTLVDRASALSGQATDFDLDLSQFTANELTTAAADASTGYFAVTDAVVVLAGGPTPTTVSGLPRPLGALADPADDDSLPAGLATTPVGDTPADAIQALRDGAVQAVVLPTPVAIALAQADTGLTVAGQLPPDPRVQPEQFQVLLAAGSALTGCVSSAIDRLRVEGSLAELADQWVTPLAPLLS